MSSYKGKNWYDGTFKGDLRGVRWYNGIFEDGSLDTCIWINGIFVNGVAQDVTWKKGVFLNGIWKFGTWVKGTWFNGIWEDGVFKNGEWRNGKWEDGVFQEEALWHNGIWKKGTFRGAWEDGFWLGGKWQGRRWDIGYILDSEKKGNYKEDWEWEGDFVRSPISPEDYFYNENINITMKVTSSFQYATSVDCDYSTEPIWNVAVNNTVYPETAINFSEEELETITE